MKYDIYELYSFSKKLNADLKNILRKNYQKKIYEEKIGIEAINILQKIIKDILDYIS